jgi:hypothetical protein
MLVFDVRGRRILRHADREPWTDYELIAADDPRVAGVIPVQAMWEQAVEEHGVGLLNVEIMTPIYYPPADLQYHFFTKEGLCQYGVEYFPYSARTGEPL